jgi:DNA-binding FadR family transcriptional regulator
MMWYDHIGHHAVTRGQAVPDRKPHSLTLRTEAALRKRIAEGPLRVGEKLPAEKALALEFGVSRTVIREAIAALRADGLLEAKHGVGVFVSQKQDGLETPAPGVGMPRFSAAMLDMLELRMAVEVHAAGLAALRRSWAQDERIWAAAQAFADAVAADEASETADWTLHRAIAEATNNAAFQEFLDSLGLSILPRRALEGGKRSVLITRPYLEKSMAEHRAICEAISAGDAEGARAAMTTHLGRSQQRYRGLMLAGRGAGAENDIDESGEGDTITFG